MGLKGNKAYDINIYLVGLLSVIILGANWPLLGNRKTLEVHMAKMTLFLHIGMLHPFNSIIEGGYEN